MIRIPLFVVPILLVGCTGVETTTENTWSPGHKAIADKVYTGAWEFRSAAQGDGTLVRLYRRSHIVGSYDGTSYYEIAFVLPAAAKAGDSFNLKVIPPQRPFRKVGEYDRLAPMEVGEISAFRFGNPSMGWMKTAKRASVRVVSVNQSKAVLRLILKADLDPGFDFDIDREFTLKVGLPPKN
jgi:hypothetical protein